MIFKYSIGLVHDRVIAIAVCDYLDNGRGPPFYNVARTSSSAVPLGATGEDAQQEILTETSEEPGAPPERLQLWLPTQLARTGALTERRPPTSNGSRLDASMIQARIVSAPL
jgi:hypothetical protein